MKAFFVCLYVLAAYTVQAADNPPNKNVTIVIASNSAARIQYGGKDITLPIILPIRWAGDTPIVAVDDLPLPGFGTVSARVMFFEGHYAGYWKHGDHGGNMFGVINSVPPATIRDVVPRPVSR